ncbi:MAG: UDP-N-acetylglucosamine--N-acetylmuramyl-(pentapeptide) pyrophosphoryl-undecaprenol N-acetylglucosamine transferase, partial [Candidatus Berkelbacteria bacterium Licking1014_96]
DALPISEFISASHGIPKQVRDDKKSILVWGGSQGAERINEMIVEKLTDYLKKYELYHLCGEKNFAKYDALKKNLPNKLKDKYHLYGIVGREIFKMISQADLVVSRAGSSLFELAALGKATIVIPYPAAAADHQTKNADYFFKNNAAIVLKESETDAPSLKKSVDGLMQDAPRREELSENIKKLAQEDAAEIIVKYILK